MRSVCPIPFEASTTEITFGSGRRRRFPRVWTLELRVLWIPLAQGGPFTLVGIGDLENLRRHRVSSGEAFSFHEMGVLVQPLIVKFGKAFVGTFRYIPVGLARQHFEIISELLAAGLSCADAFAQDE